MDKSAPAGRPPYRGILPLLKQELGLLGRADFLTQNADWPGHLIYPDEQVSVFVDGCIWAGCQEHSLLFPDSWQSQIESNKKLIAMIDGFLVEHNWTSIRFFECEIRSNPRASAEKIVALLDRSKMQTAEVMSEEWGNETYKAKFARSEARHALGEGGETKWIRFLEYLVQSKERAIKRDIRYALIAAEGWSAADFERAWKVALKHGLVDADPLKGHIKNEFAFSCASEAGLAIHGVIKHSGKGGNRV